MFHDYDIPRQFSANWSIPAAVDDFRLVSREGEVPLLAFTARECTTEYQLLRTSGGETRVVATLRGNVGETLRYEDIDHDPVWPADYALLPRNALLFEEGVQLTGPQTESVRYAPGGLLNTIIGTGAVEATPVPEIAEAEKDQSLFS